MEMRYDYRTFGQNETLTHMILREVERKKDREKESERERVSENTRTKITRVKVMDFFFVMMCEIKKYPETPYTSDFYFIFLRTGFAMSRWTVRQNGRSRKKKS